MNAWKQKQSILSLIMLSAYFISQTTFAIKAPVLDQHLVFQIPKYFNTQTVYTTPLQAWEITPNFDYAKVGKNSYFYEIPLALSYGITDRWMASASWSPLNIINKNDGQNARGIGDATIGTKYRFPFIYDSNFSTALGMSINFPLADVNEELTDGNIQYFPYGVVAYSFPGWGYTQFILQGGLDFLERVKYNVDPKKNEPAATEVVFNTGFDVPSNHINYLFLFNLVNNQWSGGKTNIITFNPGILWQPVSSFTTGAAVPLRLNKGANQLGALIFMDYIFAV